MDAHAGRARLFRPLVLQKSAKLKVRTIIVASALIVSYLVVNPCKPLKSHNQLHQKYKSARQKNYNSKLKLWFINSGDSIIYTQRDTKKDWSTSGAWQGKIKNGWPGGAPIGKQKEPKKHPASKKANRPQNQSGLLKPTTFKQKNKADEKKSNIFHAEEPVAVGKASRRKSLLKSHSTENPKGKMASLLKRKRSSSPEGSDKKARRTVTFSENLESVKFFPVERSTLSKNLVEDKEEPTPEKNKTKDNDVFSYAVDCHDYWRVLQLLKKGYNPQQKDSNNKLPMQYVYDNIRDLTRELNGANGSSSAKMSPADRAQKNKRLMEMNLKKKLLKIFNEIELGVDVARSLDEFVTVEVR